ncbi:hypothetical protein V9L05_05910 [Bernardetia sp. Wsw4-3y2]|uniref:hypothetical protein n=1 Tax=Bernardetia sp. Wsw4-3y2 TaxID=3127471 RepID=UPI0030CB9825
MAISKKGSREINVNGIEYLYKVSKIKTKSEWREQADELNDTFVKYASHYGLGKVMDITINIVIQLKDNPVSSLLIKINSILVDGFMGAEQITQIKPKFIADMINKGLNDGWKPSLKGNHSINILETHSKEKEPIILQLPNMNEVIENYQNLEKPIEIKINL